MPAKGLRSFVHYSVPNLLWMFMLLLCGGFLYFSYIGKAYHLLIFYSGSLNTVIYLEFHGGVFFSQFYKSFYNNLQQKCSLIL